MSATVVQAVSDAIYEVRAELAVFILALCCHAVLFGAYRWKPSQGKKSVKGAAEESVGKPRAAPPSQIPGAAALIRMAKQLLRQGASRSTMAEEFAAQVKANAIEDISGAFASVFESVGRNATAELIGAVHTVLSNLDMQPNQCLGEMMLRSCLALGLKSEFKEILSEVEASVGVTPVIATLAMRSTLRSADLKTAMEYLGRFSSLLKKSSGGTPSSTQQQLLQQLLQMAGKEAALPEMAREFANCGFLTSSVMEAALMECTVKATKGSTQIGDLEQLARSHGVELTDAACAAVVRGTDTPESAMRVLSDAIKRGPLGKELLVTALNAAVSHRSTALAEAAKKQIPKSPAPEVAVALLRTIIEGASRGKEHDIAVLSTYEEYLAGVDILADARIGRCVAEAAIRQNKLPVLGQVLKATPDNRRQVALIKSFSSDRRLTDAMKVFEACPEKTVLTYNSILDASIDGQEFEAAERIMSEALAAGMADVVTYNTIIKNHLQRGHLKSARGVIEAMRLAGGSLAPNTVTFNELIDAAIKHDSQGVWVLIDEMKACGLKPTSVTCSILLKSIQHYSKASDVERIMAYVDAIEDAMDEVLLSSLCEACIRAGRRDLLAKELQRQGISKTMQVCGAQTCGSIIRAYGFLRDMRGAKEAWRQMRRRKIVPTSITIGCMVEALVSNGDPESGFKLVHELASDDDTKPLLNAIIYCSVLKGFTHQKMFDRVWVVYEEMMKGQFQFSVVTYNALIDACARAGDMGRVQGFLDDMAKQNIDPNIVTYSTVMKGYCQENRLDKAFELFEAMKKSTEYRPDEIAYNTLIDGCAQRGMFDQGVKLLQEMTAAGVPPSTFTLSVLVKLANRGKRPEKAFEFVEQLGRKYRLQPNVHVYTNLVHACTAHGDLRRALEVVGRMAHERVRPDVRTYSLLLRACVGAGEFREAVMLMRLAFGIRGPPLPTLIASLVQGCEASLRLNSVLPADLVAEILEAVARGGGDDHLAMQLCKDLRSVPGLKLDPKLSMTVTSQVLRKPY
uniref:PROP1-like PPR domain-containing protein n=1 Tax=Alexandrium catenella TaxID=2925 RepID=A0A7S1R0S9_ALECA|mmetsp:Transcript_42709/g.115173  ORF Transcript_42709/g.115173 Transcript_42709/m.115173 type:complete len:1023 (+) Transcript_42709:101-3169(+)